MQLNKANLKNHKYNDIMKRIILASTSVRRKEILAILGIPFSVEASAYEEDMTLDMPPEKLAAYLSLGKAQAVAAKHTDAIIIALLDISIL